MKYKWISHLDLVPVPKLSHYNMQVFQNPKKIRNRRHFRSQAFRIRDTQPVILGRLLCSLVLEIQLYCLLGSMIFIKTAILYFRI
jgi:hypothetical protein